MKIESKVSGSKVEMFIQDENQNKFEFSMNSEQTLSLINLLLEKYYSIITGKKTEATVPT